jgi:type VI protein secretion system component VasF
MEQSDRTSSPLERCSALMLMLASFRASPTETPEALADFRKRLLTCLEETLDTTGAPAGICDSLHRLREPLIYGVDGVVVGAIPDSAEAWPRLEMELLGTMDGGDRFFDLLETSNQFRRPETGEVLLALLQLGFRGRYADDEARLKQLREQLVESTGHSTGHHDRFTTEAYERIQVGSSPQHVPVRLLRILALAIAGVLLVVLAEDAMNASIVNQLLDTVRHST